MSAASERRPVSVPERRRCCSANSTSAPSARVSGVDLRKTSGESFTASTLSSMVDEVSTVPLARMTISVTGLAMVSTCRMLPYPSRSSSGGAGVSSVQSSTRCWAFVCGTSLKYWVL
jgi:hypothetical protein